MAVMTILAGINPHDEGLVLQAAARVADGQLPYRDFYANYGPGQYYLLGGLDWAFGPSLITWRIVRVALDALVATLAYALAGREGPDARAVGGCRGGSGHGAARLEEELVGAGVVGLVGEGGGLGGGAPGLPSRCR